MADGVGEGGLLPPEQVLRQPAVALEGLAQQVFAYAVPVHLQRRVEAHDVADEEDVAEGHARLEAVRADAAVGAQHVVHVYLVHALFALALEFLRRGREVRVFIAEELVGYLAREQDAHVRALVYVFADEVHAEARAYGRDVVGAQQVDKPVERG